VTASPANLPFEDLERIYALLAESIDAVGAEHETLFLSKLALILAQEVGDYDKVAAAIEAARLDLDEA
jgi:hypothetical protein